MNKGCYLRGIAAPGLRPFIYASPPVLARGTREPRQQMDVQVRDSITDHGRIDVLRASDFAQGLARSRTPPAHAACLGVGQVGQAGCVPQRLYEEVSEVGGRAIAAQYIRWDDVGDEDEVIFGNRPTGYQRTPVAVLAADETVCAGTDCRHVRQSCHQSEVAVAARRLLLRLGLVSLSLRYRGRDAYHLVSCPNL
jgi:hypothetical protein